MSKEKILEAAFQLFSTGCYSSVALSEIAEKSEIKKPSIYAHFKSKEELFLEVLDIELHKLIKHVRKSIKQTENYHTSIALQDLLVKSLEYVIQNEPVGSFWSNLLFGTQKELMEEISIRTSTLKNFVQEEVLLIFQRGVERGEIEEQDLQGLVYSYLCLLQGNLVMTLNSKLLNMENILMSSKGFWEGVSKNIKI
jgi:TetR/AcrR family transcriptional regulator, cmeABC operon repressor